MDEKCNLKKDNSLNKIEDNIEYDIIKELESENNNYKLNKVFPSNKDLRSRSSLLKNKIDKILSLDTIVYDIFNPGENRNKNYDRVVSEIKNVEHIANIEKEKLKKKIFSIKKRLNENKYTKSSKNLLHFNDIKENNEEENNDENYNEASQNKIFNLQMKKLLLIEYEKDNKYNYLEVIEKLKIPPEKRKIRDVLRIKTYMEQSKLGLNFRDEFSDINIAEKLIYFCSIEMRYLKFKKNETIIKIGDPPDSFFTIIFGKVNIIKPMPKTELLTGFEYFKYLMNMKKQNENYIFSECLRVNRTNYHIESNDGEIIKYIYLLKYLDHLKTNNEKKIDLDEVLDLLDIKPEELGIHPEHVTDNYYISDHRKKIIKKIPIISPDLIEQYSFIINNISKNKVTIYEYKKFMTLKSNDYFGDSAIETNSPRNATIIAEEETDMAYLSNKLYYSQIASEKAILLQIKIKFLHQNFFFNRIKYHKFSKKYFTLFISDKYGKGDKLITEGENVNFIYFIQEGSVEITTSKSMNEIEDLINLINDKIDIFKKNNYLEFKLEAIRNKETKGNNLKENNNINEYSQINSTYKDMVDFIQQKQINKIIILNSNEDIGLISYFLGNSYLGTCEIISKYAKIYKIEKEYLEQILEEEILINYDFYKRLKNKLKLYSERLFQINNIKLVMTDEKITQHKLDQKKLEEKKINQTNTSINKISIKYDKLNSYLNEKNDMIKNNNNILTNSNSYRNRIKPKIDINLPKLNYTRNKNKLLFSFPSINSINDDNNENNIKIRGIKVNKLIRNNKKFDNIKLFNIVNKKEKLTLSQKVTFEKKILLKKNKYFNIISKSKNSLSKDKVQLDTSTKAIYDSPSKKNNDVYLTNLSTNNQKSIKTPNGKIIKKKNSQNSIKSPILPNIEKFLENTEKSMNTEISRNFNKKINERYNTENNIIIYNNKKIEILKENENGLKRRINHPYYDPLTLIKKEQYRIFENKNFNVRNKFKKDYLNLHIERIRELKKIRDYLGSNFKIRLKTNNIHDNEDY